MIKCPSCHKGMLRKDYGQPIECGECSAVFEIVNGVLQMMPIGEPKHTGRPIQTKVLSPIKIITPASRRVYDD